ncbi:hypothetical protein OHT57_47115 (plasmid) [Streptomyces sp. NBC_00285]|uniref:hypothetical protein n=1 Tax=Streptomyces sp. NBC_00285 TaxID=2975700 RepID=UPI002E286805|nr:hypothetical protein [Streptomyces sp. NBC_00285]
MTPQRTRTADDNPQLPDDDEDIKVGDDVRPGAKKRTPATPTSRKELGLPPRKRGRPTGPTRVMMNVRVLLETDELVTAIGEAMGVGPQDVADAAIAYYAQHLRRTGKLPKTSEKKDQEQPEAS